MNVIWLVSVNNEDVLNKYMKRGLDEVTYEKNEQDDTEA